MASATASKKSKQKKRKEELEAKRSNAEFRDEQRKEAANQGQVSDTAVPEKRPQAHQQQGEESARFQEELENGERDPMPESAHVKADSSAQQARAEKQERKLGPDTLTEGARVRITSGIYEGATGSVTKVEYASFVEKQKATSGDPSIARFAKASSYMVRTRGGDHALVEVTPDQVEVIDKLGIDSSEV